MNLNYNFTLNFFLCTNFLSKNLDLLFLIFTICCNLFNSTNNLVGSYLLIFSVFSIS